MFVLGTAGHIDHGKSVLVQALTGIDPDRLREEKERGMTIDLGFAWLTLPGGREVGIVDVPGHERFIKNMLAGVGGIDLALLIVAANEGVMPQTKEHLAILDLLGVRRGVVVITKKDLVDEELLSLVALEVEELIRSTTLSEAPVVAVSALSGEGIAELVAVIDESLKSAEPRRDIGRPRLPIDRVFSISGSGTVVTGTLLDGSLSRGQEVEIVPPGLRSRLRGVQTHKARIDTASPGSRVAANLTGVTTAQLKRGDVLASPGWLIPTTMMDARLHLLPYLQRPLRHNATVSFHTGAAEAVAKIRMLDKEELKPGEDGWAQLSLDRPLAVVKNDRFIIRSSRDTLGGGNIIVPHTRRHRRFRSAIIQRLNVRESGTAHEVIMTTLEAKQPVEQASFLLECDLPAGEVQGAIDSLVEQEQVVATGEGEHRLLFTRAGWGRVMEKAANILEDYHHRYPLRPGMPKVELRSKLKLPSAAVLQRLSEDGVLVEEKASVRLPAHQIRLSPEQQAKIDDFLRSLTENPYAPPGDLRPEPDLVNLLVEQGRVVKVSESVVFAAPAYDEMVRRITDHMKEQGKVTLAEVRDLFGTSRKYAQALLEYLDEKKITHRVGDERRLRQKPD
jgi:selenocysteine-specific elongation factor